MTATLEDWQLGRREVRSEADLLAAVIAFAERKGLKWFHSYDPVRDRQKGFPDLVLVGAKGVIWRELKGEQTLVTPDQKEWGKQLQRAGQDWAVWRPEDWYSGRVEREVLAVA